MNKNRFSIWIPRLITALFLLLIAAFLIQMPVSSAGLTRLVLITKSEKLALPIHLHILEDYGSFVMAEVPTSDLAQLQVRYLVDLLPERTLVNLPGASFDSVRYRPQIPVSLQAAQDDPYFLIQFYGPIKQEWLTELEKLGVAFLGYHPSYTFIARMDPVLLPQVQATHAVQWVERYHPVYRLPDQAQIIKAQKRGEQIKLILSIFSGESIDELMAQLITAGASIEKIYSNDPAEAHIWIVPDQINTLARIPGIYRIEAYEMPTLDNERGVAVSHTWDVWKASRNSLLQDLMGAGQISGMVDSGLDDNDTTPLHNDFYDFTNGMQTSRIQAARPGNGCGGSCKCADQDDAITSGHGTHVAGSIVGNGYNSLLQLGLQAQARGADPYFDYAFGVGQAPEAKIVFAYTADKDDGSLCGIGAPYLTWIDIRSQGARNVNNSWGNLTTTYGGSGLQADYVMWLYQDFLILASASNDGPGWNTVTQPGTAKNILTVGAAGNHRSVWTASSDTASALTDFSSRGPVNLGGGDGRFKPDIVATGADILSTRSTFIANNVVTLWANESGDGDGDGHLDYWWSGGTSMSSPHATGAATIVRDYLEDIKGFTSTTPPSAALIKAMLVNGAVDMGYGYESLSSSPYGGRNLQGWGMVNVEQSILPHAPRSFIFDDFTNISNSVTQSTRGMNSSGDYVQYTINVADSSEPLKITVTWTDRQNSTDGYAINNLDLLVTSPSATTYLGNVFSGSWSTTAGSADSKNNTEAVYIQNPETGNWIIRVTATNIIASTQPYAIVISGGLGVNPSYTRTCSGTTPDCSGRIGTSALSNFPTIKPLSGTQEHTYPGTTVVTNIRITNWGTNSDTISLSSAATTMAGAAAAGISVVYNPTGPFTLAPGASQDVQVVVMVGDTVANGPYDVTLTATGAGNRKMAEVIGLNVIPSTNLLNGSRVASTNGPQYLADFWGSGSNLWTVYATGESHNNSEADIRAMCSADGGQTWTDTGQVNAVDELYYYAAAIGGSSDGSYVTVAWNLANGAGVYARTWTRISDCTGTWGSIVTLYNYGTPGVYFISDPEVIYDGDTSNAPDILIAWLEYNMTVSATGGVAYAVSTDSGASFSARAWVPDASGTSVTHRWPSFALDTRLNDIWMSYSYRVSGLNRDIRLKRWNGDTNAWAAAGTYVAVASTTEREAHSGIAYIQGATAAQDSLWVGWQRYLADNTTSSARIYYARSSGTLPSVTFPTTYGPYATRSSEGVSPAITGDSSYAYISYLAYNDSFRGANPYIMRVPIAGGAPDLTYQVSATVDDQPLKARGNAGMARLLWLTTTFNGKTFTGPTMLYSKNSPDSENPNYGGNLGTAQTLFNMEENFDLYLAQAQYNTLGNTYADTDGICAGNLPCFTSFQSAINAVVADGTGVVTVYPKTFNEDVTLNKNATVNFVGSATINSLTISAGTFNAPAGTLSLNGNFTYSGGMVNHNNGTISMAGPAIQSIGGTQNYTFYNLVINNSAGVTLNQPANVNNVLTLSSGAFTNGANLTLANGVTIARSVGSLSAVPTFGATVHVSYNGTTGVTSGFELPVSITVLSNLTINNSGGVALNQNQTVNETLTLTSGLLTLGSNHLIMGPTATFGGSPSAAAMIVPTGSGELRQTINTSDPAAITFPIGDNTGTAEYSPATLDFSGATGSGYVALRLTNALHPQNGPLPRLLRYWTVTQSGLTAFSCAATFNYVDGDLDIALPADEALIYGRKWDSAWTVFNAVNAAANSFAMNVTSFSDFTGGPQNPTSVLLSYLHAIPGPSWIEIAWETLMEINNLGFNIHRSENPDGPLTKINVSLIPSKSPGGNQGAAYSFIDTSVVPGVTYYYWIEFVGVDGSAFEGPTFAAPNWPIYIPLVKR